jgi:hypothetical protein
MIDEHAFGIARRLPVAQSIVTSVRPSCVGSLTAGAGACGHGISPAPTTPPSVGDYWASPAARKTTSLGTGVESGSYGRNSAVGVWANNSFGLFKNTGRFRQYSRRPASCYRFGRRANLDRRVQ